MESIFKSALSRQFASAIDMLENAMQACPEGLWQLRMWNDPQLPGAAEFWYIIYHTLFWLDLYLSGALAGFTPPPPFNLDELDPAGLLPERAYTKAELQAYLEHDRLKCRTTIASLTDERAAQSCKFSWGELPFVELLMDNMRHVQEHGAQLNLTLGQKIGWSPKWVTKSEPA